jgi:hypothetical protein
MTIRWSRMPSRSPFKRGYEGVGGSDRIYTIGKAAIGWRLQTYGRKPQHFMSLDAAFRAADGMEARDTRR